MPTLRPTQNQTRERSVRYVRVEFYDKDDAPTIPTAVRYRVDCLTNQRQIVGWTDLDPASVVEFTITPDQNRILDDSNKAEDRQVVIEATGTDGTTLHRLPGLGHLAHEEAPQRVAELILSIAAEAGSASQVTR